MIRLQVIAILIAWAAVQTSELQAQWNDLQMPYGNAFMENGGQKRVNLGYLLVRTPLDLTKDQAKRIQELVDSYLELKQAMLRPQAKKQMEMMEASPDGLSPEALAEIRARTAVTQADLFLRQLDIDKQIIEILNPEQIERLKKAAKAMALSQFHSFYEMVAQAARQKEIAFRTPPGFWQKQDEIVAKYRLKMAELQAEMVDELLETMPEDVEQATEYMFGTDIMKPQKK